MYNYYNYPDEYLMHYGVKGMKWGHRKRQAFSVSATKHRIAAKTYDINSKFYSKNNRNRALASANATARNQALKKAEKAQASANAKKAERDAIRNTPEAIAARKAKMKKAAIAGAAVAGTALAAYGAYKFGKWVKSTNCKIAAKEGREFAEQKFSSLRESMRNTPLKPGQSLTFNGNSGSRSSAANAARRASRDDFRTAARNVVDYRKRMGKGSLRNLSSVDYYTSLPEQMSNFTRRG